MNEWIQFGLFFLGVTGFVWLLLSLGARRRTPPDDRLQVEDEGATEEPVFGTFTEALSEQLPQTRQGRVELEKELRLAGYYRATALIDYKAVRALLVLLPLIFAGVLALTNPPSQMQVLLLYGVLGAMLGYSLPRLYLAARKRARAREMERGLPLTIDLLALCLSSGQNLINAMQQVSEELRETNPVLAEELAIACRHTQLHSLEYAMRNWSDRVGTPEVTNLALVLIQSERLGTDAAFTLQELATNLRTTARQRAEAQANRTSFWMLFPTVFCFWIAAAIILIGPPYLDFFQQRKQSMDKLNQTRNNIDRANNPRRGVRADNANAGAGVARPGPNVINVQP